MIPKQLFFIWIGDNKPNYVDFAVNTFKEVNPDFKVDLIEDSLNNPKTEYVKELNYIYDNNCTSGNFEYLDIFKKELRTYTSLHYKKNNRVLVISNILRVYLIYKYGGMYLDCDTFPVKRFDDRLLSEPFQTYHDNFWLGGIKGNIIVNNNSKYQSRNIGKYIRTFYEKNILDDIDYNPYKRNCKKRFMNLELKYGEKILDNYDCWDYYIDHYIQRTGR